MTRTERIAHMETLLDRVTSADRYDRVLPELNTLYGYYFSPLWLSDYEADESGLLPHALKRGVLAQDTLYNLLTDWKSSCQEDTTMET